MILKYSEDNLQSRQPLKLQKKYAQPINKNNHNISHQKIFSQSPDILKKTLLTAKINALNRNFIRKLKKNNTQRTSVSQQQLDQFQNIKQDQLQNRNSSKFMKFIKNQKGLQIGVQFILVFTIINIILNICLIIRQSIILTFQELRRINALGWFQIISFLFFVLNIITQCAVQTSKFNSRLSTLYQIMQYNFKRGTILIDLICIVLNIAQQVSQYHFSQIQIILFLFRLRATFTTFYHHKYYFQIRKDLKRYYNLVMIFIINFLIGHVISIALNLMIYAGPTNNNWHVKLGINLNQWYIKYIWGYYWAVNIILTVGFGDLTATNHTQALFIIFIEIFGCITLAWNIGQVSSILTQIKKSNQHLSQSHEIFAALCNKNQISQSTKDSIHNYIKQSFKIKQLYNYEKQTSFINLLPISLKNQYLTQVNTRLFKSIIFLKDLSQPTIFKIAQQITRKIAHPNQKICQKGQLVNFMILQKGSLSYNCYIFQSSISGKQIQRIQIDQQKKQSPKLLSLQFLKMKRLKYDIKSNQYSIYYVLDRQKFKQILKNVSQFDFQYFCNLQDRDDYFEGQNQIFPCSLCIKDYHNKFKCDRIHFVPLKSMVIYKYIANQKKLRQPRKKLQRLKQLVRPLIKRKQIKKDFKLYVEQQFGLQYFTQMSKRFNIIRQIQKNSTKTNQKSSNRSLLNKRNSLKGQRLISDLTENDFLQLQRLMLNNIDEHMSFWGIESDEVKNFKYYMIDWNIKSTKSKNPFMREGHMNRGRVLNRSNIFYDNIFFSYKGSLSNGKKNIERPRSIFCSKSYKSRQQQSYDS